MSFTTSYTFNKSDRLGSDASYNTQHSIQNTKFANYNLASYQSEDITPDIMYFASQTPAMIVSGSSRGSGLTGSIINVDSSLRIDAAKQNKLMENIDLRQRMFMSVPYLGRGAGDIPVETKLQRGDSESKRPSLTDTSITGYVIYPNEKMQEMNDNAVHLENSNQDRVGINARFVANSNKNG